MEALFTYFKDLGLSEPDTQAILSTFQPKILEKGDHFIQENQTCKQLAFVESGLFQYYLLSDGVERTTYIATENNFVTSLVSFLKGVPSRENIRALSDARIWTINRTQLQQLMQDIPALKDFYIGLLEWQIGCIDNSRFDLITLNAEQRYQKLLDEEPELLQRIPLQYLASILGVTPRHLSRIRGK
jgi:CRP-like cAMP-binding protein